MKHTRRKARKRERDRRKSRKLRFVEAFTKKREPVFVDVFAGCGGLSLGLMEAGWKGLFAIEKDSCAFETLSANFLEPSSRLSFEWPSWLPKSNICIAEAISKYGKQIANLAGNVDLLVGGPPCQGYSSAGRRDPSDPRNQLFESYLELVDLLKPKIVLIENVRGITQDFKSVSPDDEGINYSEKLTQSLSKDYKVHSCMLNLSQFGVPQNRSRFFLIGIKKDHLIQSDVHENPFDQIESNRVGFLCSKGLTSAISAKAALSDLEVKRNGTQPSSESKGFQEITYKYPITPYQRLMRRLSKNPPSDTRLANHKDNIVQRFREIITLCHADGRLNVSLSREVREGYGLKKQAIRVLDPDRPSPTVTSMPDDLLHYSEPRTLTVRENARLQSFPDWFIFRGKYTTGGHRRRLEVPRFTQVANAVPPLAAEAIGQSLLAYVSDKDDSLIELSVPSNASMLNPRALARSSKRSR